MDDLKPFSRDETKLQQELIILKTFSDDIEVELDVVKCATAIFKHGRRTNSQNISLNNQTVIRNMELDKTFKYLGIEEGGGIDNSQMTDKLVKEYYSQVQQILKTELNSQNKITTIITLAVPVLVYSFIIVNIRK
jgi:pantothenate synthetase